MAPNETSFFFQDGKDRIILTWGIEPVDLDLHLYICDSTSTCHIFYSSKICTGANLDIDDRTSYGPETITIETYDVSKTYLLYVHDYTNRESSSPVSISEGIIDLRPSGEDKVSLTYPEGTDKRTDVWSRPSCIYTQNFSPEKNCLKPNKKYFPKFF